MKNATTRRLRGFRIQVYHKGKPSIITPTIWAEQPPVEQWELVTQDPETIQADLFRSGRKMKGYHYKRTGKPWCYSIGEKPIRRASGFGP